jgi:hypothetical protein
MKNAFFGRERSTEDRAGITRRHSGKSATQADWARPVPPASSGCNSILTKPFVAVEVVAHVESLTLDKDGNATVKVSANPL